MFCHFSKLSKDFPHSITISKSSLWSPKAFIQTSVLTSFLNYSSFPYQCINTHLSAVHQTHQMSSSVRHGTAVYVAKITRKSHPHFSWLVLSSPFSNVTLSESPLQVHTFTDCVHTQCYALSGFPLSSKDQRAPDIIYLRFATQC